MRRPLLLGGALTCCLVAAGQAQDAVPDLTGTWRYNAGASGVGGTGGDDSTTGALGGFGAPGRQPLGGIGAAGPPIGGRMGPVDPDARKQRIALVRELLEPARRLTITQDDTSVSVVADHGPLMRYRTNGRPEKHQAINGVVETETRWRRGRLVRETFLDDGRSIEEAFSLETPRALVVEVTVHAGVGRRTPVRRVYDPVE